MGKALEKDIRSPCIKWAKAEGWLHKRMHFGRGAAAGWPDDLFIRGGSHVWVEFKRPGKQPTKLQRFTHKQMAYHGARVYLIDDLNEFRLLLRL